MDTTQEVTQEPKKGISTLTKILIAAILVLAAVLVQIFVISGQAREMHMEITDVSVTYDFDANVMFYSNNSRFFYFVSRDGVRMLGSNGNDSWRDSVSFSRPITATAGDVIAVGDYRGRHVYVYNANGRSFSIDANYPVINLSVTETGILTVIVSYGSGFGVYVYTRQRFNYPGAFYWTVHENDGMYFPSMAEVSDDGRYMAIAVMDLNVRVPSTNVLFFYTSQADAAWGTERGLFATESFPDQLVTAMRFMDNNRLVVAGTGEIRCFQVGPGHAQVREVWSLELHNRLSHLQFYGGSHFAFATDDRFVGADEGDAVGTIRIFSVNGVESGVFHLGRRVTHLTMGQGALIVGAERNFHAVDLRGNPLWEHTTLHDTRSIIFLDNTDTVLIAGVNRAYVFRRRRMRDNDVNMGIQDLEYGEL